MRWFKLCQSRAFLNPSTSRSALPSTFVTFWSLGCIKYYTFIKIRFLPHSKHTIHHHRYQFGDCCLGKWSVFILWIVRNAVMSWGGGGGPWVFFFLKINCQLWRETACYIPSCPSVRPTDCPNGRTRLAHVRFSWNVIFTKFSSHIPNLNRTDTSRHLARRHTF